MSENDEATPPTDRRVRRTHEALIRALLELILERGFEAITVSEIADRADVGRSTFYAHYADKEDLLQSSVQQLHAYLSGFVDEAVANPRPGRHPALAFCLPMLEHAQEQHVLFQRMAGRPGGNLIVELFHEQWADLVRSGWPEADEVAVQAIAGGFGSIIAWWLSRAPELSPGEVEERFRRLIEPTLLASS